ncbi:MAG TPA: hypothetical protein VHR66_01045 [Gemmataceae bacterium]|jgi:hypothetical protein|nr:hypothetical protein [Gemmataceae bacterium]
MKDDGFRGRFDPEKRLADLRGEGKNNTADDEDIFEAEPDSGTDAFSVISADRQQKIMVEFRFKDGNAKARAYSYCVGIDYNPSEGIKMDFGEQEVRLSGRNLEPLFAGLVSQRVAVVREMDKLHAEAIVPEKNTVVTRIEVIDPDDK